MRENQVSGMWGKGGGNLCAPNMALFVYYLENTELSLCYADELLWLRKGGINGCLFECEEGAMAGLE